MTDLERATAMAVEALGLSQLSELETCNSAIVGDFMDLMDTTEMPSAAAWRGLCERLQQWKGANAEDAGDFWAVLSGQAGLGHKALLAMIHLALKSPDKGPQAWLAAKAYLWLMDLPGASAYGIFSAALFRSLLALLKRANEGSGGKASSSAAGEVKGAKKPARRGGRGRKDEEEDEDDDMDEDDSDSEPVKRGGRGATASKRGGGSSRSESDEHALLSAIVASLTSGSLRTSLRGHEDLQGELAEISLAIHAVATSPLATPAREVFLRLLSGGGQSAAGNPAALHALMPLLTMKPAGNKSGMPTDARSRTAAHNKAVQLVLALIQEAKDRPPATEEEEEEGEEERDDSRMEVEDEEKKQEEEEEEGGDESEEEDDDDMEEEEEEGGGKKGGKQDKRKQQKKKGGKKAKGKGGKKAVSGGKAPTTLELSVLAVLEHMCTDAPDRADTRSRLVDSCLTILQSLQQSFPTLAPRFLAFLAKLLRSAKVSHRTLAVELSASFVNTPWAWDSLQDQDESDASHLAMEALVRSLASRVLDKAPTVRARAMVCLSDILLRLKEEMQREQDGEEDQPASRRQAARRTPEGLRDILRSLALPKDGAEGQDLIAMVRGRCHDDKAAVRKAALQALEVLLSSLPTRLSDADVALFSHRCNDLSVLTRKQAMASLSALLLADPTNTQLQEAWVRSVLPLVSDPEQSILSRLVDLLNDVVVDRVLAWHKHSHIHRPSRSASSSSSDSPASSSPSLAVWQLLALVASRDLNKCLQSAITLLLQGGGPHQASTSAPSPRRLKDLMDALQAAALASIESDADAASRLFLRRGSWALLEALLTSTATTGPSSTSPKLVSSDPAFVITCWRKIADHLGPSSSHNEDEQAALEDDARKVLRVLSRLASDVPATEGMELAEDLLASLAGLDPKLSPENCGAALDTISALCLAKAPSSDEGVSILTTAAGQILEACEAALRAFIVDRQSEEEVLQRLQRAVFLTGAVALLGFNPNEEDVKPSAANKRKKQQEAAAGSGPIIRIPVPAALVSLVRVLLAPEIMPLGADLGEAQDATAAIKVPDEVRAHAFLSLGKVCLRDKTLAKENVNLFVRELALSHSPAIRSNALLILGDLCVRYTSLVERHVPAMARCLQDDSPLIRRHAQALISQLLLQDYLKWKGLLLHRYLAVLVDKDKRVSDMAEFMLFSQFQRKHPSLFTTHFVEAMVVLNGCIDHDAYKAAMAQGAESGTAVTMEGVDMEGGQGQPRRMRIYRAMLQRMSDEQRIQVAAKITQDILGAATDEDDQISSGIRIQSYHHGAKGNTRRREAMLVRKLQRDESLVKDAIAVLRCPDIKVASSAGGARGGGDGDEDPETMMAAEESAAAGGGADAAQAAKGRLLSKVSRKHLLEHVVPTLVSLKACLERAHSPLLKDVMEYFQELMKASREEVKEALSSDPTLFHEVDYDLQQYEKQCAKQAAEAKRAAAEAAARKSMPPPPPRSPGDALKASNLNRRRSSVGGPLTAAVPHATPSLTAALSSGKPLTPALAACSAPRLRRSSIGGANSTIGRTPSEAVRAALLPTDELASPQPLTPVPRGRRSDEDAAAVSSSATDKAGGGAMKVKLPDAIREWNVTVQESPLDKENQRGAAAVMEEGEEDGEAMAM